MADDSLVGSTAVPPPAAIRPVVLVVDDEPPIRHLVSHLLVTHGFDVQLAADGASAIYLATAVHVDAVILDLTMPGKASGLDVLAWFRSNPSYVTLPVLILTGHADLPEDAEELIRRQYAYVFYKQQPLTTLLDHLTRLTLH
jgi:CheY-like chemotaxis protein